MSNGFELSGIFKNPAHCSNAFGPNPLTFFKSSRLVIFPFASRYATIFFARLELIPETYLRRDADAVLRFTPTWFTTEPTTSSSFSVVSRCPSAMLSAFSCAFLTARMHAAFPLGCSGQYRRSSSSSGDIKKRHCPECLNPRKKQDGNRL